MKSVTLCTLILLIASCCEDAPENKQHEISVLPILISHAGKSYQESLQAWSESKGIHGDSYVYQTTFTSWTGSGNTTEIRVDDGVVTTRIYQEFQINQSDGEKTVTFSYRESGADVGSDPKGAEPLTIDELYQTCAKDFLSADVENNTIYFQTSNEGMMTICGFVPEGCIDDCYHGIRIHSFAWQQ